MIICAALLFEMNDTKEQIVVPCFRHGLGYEMLFSMSMLNKGKVIKEGFITHSNKFVDRNEAFVHAKFYGQLSQANRWYKEDHGETELYSEDLY